MTDEKTKPRSAGLPPELARLAMEPDTRKTFERLSRWLVVTATGEDLGPRELPDPSTPERAAWRVSVDHGNRSRLLTCWEHMTYWRRLMGDDARAMWTQWRDLTARLWGDGVVEELRAWDRRHADSGRDCAAPPDEGHPWECMACRWPSVPVDSATPRTKETP